MNRYEQDIQRSVFQHLRARGMPGVFAFHVPNGTLLGGKRNRKGVNIQGAILKGLGVLPGVPDIIAINRGTVHALELKHLQGKVSEAQKATMDALELAGARVAVAYTLDEALVTLEAWGILRRDASRSVIHRVPETTESATG
jgi:hypothetical protein